MNASLNDVPHSEVMMQSLNTKNRKETEISNSNFKVSQKEEINALKNRVSLLEEMIKQLHAKNEEDSKISSSDLEFMLSNKLKQLADAQTRIFENKARDELNFKYQLSLKSLEEKIQNDLQNAFLSFKNEIYENVSEKIESKFYFQTIRDKDEPVNWIEVVKFPKDFLQDYIDKKIEECETKLSNILVQKLNYNSDLNKKLSYSLNEALLTGFDNQKKKVDEIISTQLSKMKGYEEILKNASECQKINAGSCEEIKSQNQEYSIDTLSNVVETKITTMQNITSQLYEDNLGIQKKSLDNIMSTLSRQAAKWEGRDTCSNSLYGVSIFNTSFDSCR